MHITSDLGNQSTLRFWTSFCQQLKIQVHVSTAYHPATDGQSERLIAVMEQYLRCSVSFQQEDWAQWLTMALFAANNQVASATKATPFIANYRFHPASTCILLPWTLPLQPSMPKYSSKPWLIFTVSSVLRCYTPRTDTKQALISHGHPPYSTALATMCSCRSKISEPPALPANWIGHESGPLLSKSSSLSTPMT